MFKNKQHIIYTVALAFSLILSGCDMTNTPQQEERETTPNSIIKGQYIVVLNSSEAITKAPEKGDTGDRASAARSVDREATIQSANAMLEEAGIDRSVVKNYYSHAIAGFALQADRAQIEALKKDPRVAYVEKDRMVSLPPVEAQPGALPGDAGKGEQTSAPGDYEPYGITRVGGPVDGTGSYAWVIDTGIDLDHSDLNVNTTYSESFVSSEPSPNDQNGHGTHVAGTIGAKSNGFGVIGVSYNTTLFAVKVLNRDGNGSYSDIIAGVDYVAQYAYAGEVANLSLGGPTSQALDDAVRNCADAGVLISLAAGNDGANANYSSPARVNHPNVRTVSAIDSNDNFASFSNYANPPIDWAAPGVGVWSTWIGDQYNQISGTSMASPHVGGLMVTGSITTGGYASGDPDGNADPIAVRN